VCLASAVAVSGRAASHTDADVVPYARAASPHALHLQRGGRGGGYARKTCGGR
jgi:hypothetical protein